MCHCYLEGLPDAARTLPAYTATATGGAPPVPHQLDRIALPSEVVRIMPQPVDQLLLMMRQSRVGKRV